VVPGGVGAGDLPSIFRATDLTPLVLLVSILTAAALGAGHALTPGHGKTLMAAYLVGTLGTPVHAAGLGLSVALSHTLGILALAGLVVGAQGLLPPEVVVRTAPVVAAVSIVAIGGWMLSGEARRRWNGRREQLDPRHGHHHPHDHDHDHEHEHDDETPGQHTHGGRRHSHLPMPGSTISWRSLFVLGLAGGLIPSASALLILLGAVAAGRPRQAGPRRHLDLAWASDRAPPTARLVPGPRIRHLPHDPGDLGQPGVVGHRHAHPRIPCHPCTT
jgi:ABC-type nickel/cobalt efflux system permease component RcnA